MFWPKFFSILLTVFNQSVLRTHSNPDSKFDDEFVGETTLSRSRINFSLHNLDGSIIPKSSLRVLFGRTPKSEQIPWQVQIVYYYGDFKCGGTLVTPNKIVSAAHCFRYKRDKEYTVNPKILVVRAGDIMQVGRGSNLQERKCAEIIIHS